MNYNNPVNKPRKTNRLAQIETRLQSLIEGSAARFFTRSTPEQNLAQRLANEVLRGLHQGADGILVAPNLYTLFVSPEHLDELQANPGLFDQLSQTLEEAAAQAGVSFSSPPVLRVYPETSLRGHEITIHSQDSLADLAQTSELSQDELLHGGEFPPNAFLIVDGVRTFPLRRSVINIGRRSDNHLVVDDARVSRVHAQLRAVRRRYLLFDLDSTGGTFLNGERIRQATLSPGDVITLAGVPMVYGQDPSSETQDIGFVPSGPEVFR
ncbi:MAG TPA: FhaA domain-containing protein [Anaerolineales bacterium]|nr:FhaA domain-containing protein [Anaerolineales bacterium]